MRNRSKKNHIVEDVRKRTGRYYVPEELKDLLLRILPSQKWNKVLISRISGIKDSLEAEQKTEVDDILEMPSNEQSRFDLALITPPFGVRPKDKELLKIYGIPRKKDSLELIWISHAHGILKDDGWLFCIIPDKILNAPSKYKARKWILSRFQLRAVISASYKYSRIKSSVIVLKKGKKHEDYRSLMGKMESEEAIKEISLALRRGNEVMKSGGCIDLDEELRMDVDYNLYRQMSDSIKTAPLNEIAETSNGNPYRDSWRETATGKPVLRGRNIKEGFISEADFIFSPTSLGKYGLKEGDILITKIIPTHAAIITEKKSGYTYSADLIRIRIEAPYTPEVLCCFLNSVHGQKALAMLSYDTKIKRVNTKTLNNLAVPLTLPNSIKGEVRFLLKTGMGMNREAKEIFMSTESALKKEIDGRLEKESSNLLKPVNQFAKVIPATLSNFPQNQVVLYAQTDDVSEEFGIIETWQKSTVEDLPPMVKQPIKPGDVLIANTGTHLGTEKHRVAVVPDFYEGELVTGSFTALEFGSTPYYWATVLRHEATLEQISKFDEGNLKRKDLLSLKIPCLPYQYRENFNSKVSAAIDQRKEAIDKLNEAKSLIEEGLGQIGYCSFLNENAVVIVNPTQLDY